MVRVWFSALCVTLFFFFSEFRRGQLHSRRRSNLVLSRYWQTLSHTLWIGGIVESYRISNNPIVWFTYYVTLRDVIMYFKRQEPIGTLPKERSTPHVCESVVSPFSVIHHALFRYEMYDFFLFKTPSETYALIWRIRFRLFFMSTTTVLRKEIFLWSHDLCYATVYINHMYFDLAMEQW